MRSLLVMSLVAMISSCAKAPEAADNRVTLRRTGGTTFQIVPGEGQLPYCLAYTVSRTGLTRQLTMSKSNQSFACEPNAPIGKRTFRVPQSEGPVKVHVLFTSQPINAASVSQDLLDAKDRQTPSAMNLRLPGKASLNTIDFVPEEDVVPEIGVMLGQDAGT